MLSNPELLLAVLSLLALAMLITGLSHLLKLPSTVLLVCLGLLLNPLTPQLTALLPVGDIKLTHDLVLYVFIPGLVFQSALSLDARALLRNIAPILVMAIPGMLVSALLVATGLSASLGLPFLLCLLFGALISATDPVAVMALFKELGVSPRLSVLVEGESLLNDATAIVLFHIVLDLILTPTTPTWSFTLLTAMFDFCQIFIGGAAVGGLIGLLLSLLLVRLSRAEDSVLQVLIVFGAYFSFIIAEHNFHVSGIMATLFCALTLNMLALPRLGRHSARNTEQFWQVIVLIFNSLLFVMMGLAVDIGSLVDYGNGLFWAILAVAVARAVSVYVLIPSTTTVFRLPRLPLSNQHVMWLGGIKGALAIAMVFSLPETITAKPLLISLTSGVVLANLLINASLLKPFIRLLKIDRLPASEWQDLHEGKHLIAHSVDHVLNSFRQLRLLDDQIQASVTSALQSRLKTSNEHLNDEQSLKQIHLQALEAEQKELERLADIGLISYYTELNFREILARDRAKSIDQLLHPSIEHSGINRFVRLEMIIIKLLAQTSWSQHILVRYQHYRFSNLLQHDIAGVMIAYKALTEIKVINSNPNSEKLAIIRKAYQQRLQRRQHRLRRFSEAFPDFYQQYENHLFQEVALKYSQKLLQNECQRGFFSSRVCQRLHRTIEQALDDLPPLTLTLGRYKRHDWLEQVPLFEHLPKAVIHKLERSSGYISYLPGDTIFNEGDHGKSVYVLVFGCVLVLKKNQYGDNEVITELKPGSFIGVRALADKSGRSATLRAKSYTTLLHLATQDIKDLAQESPELAQRLSEPALYARS
ncbi:MAG: cation:proton antiporter [Methylococcales bacterium]|nr:cation:proton antiporter [Methylococcales bacterium]